MKNITPATIKTVQNLLNIIKDYVNQGYVSEGWVPSSNIFNNSPLTAKEAEEMNKNHDKVIMEHLDIANRLLGGEHIPAYSDDYSEYNQS